jgi:polyisoprenyl-phosphate glycosyltransferase
MIPASPRLSLVVPLFNEEQAIPKLIAALDTLMSALPDLQFEILLVDDGSTDQTPVLIADIARQDSRYRVIELSRNFGKEAALTAGLDHASGNAVVPFDADLQDPPDLIPKMVDAWRAGAEMVLARRVDRSSDSPGKRLSANWFYRVHNLISRHQIPENVGDFRLMDQVVVDALKRLPERERFMKGLYAWVGFRTAVIDYQRPARSAGSSKFSAWKLWNFALDGITSFSTLPLRIWTYFGVAAAICALLYSVVIVLRVSCFSE